MAVNKEKNKNEKAGKNWADVAFHIVDSTYNLINTGNLIGGILFALIMIVFLIIYRLPEDQISDVVFGSLSYIFNGNIFLVILSGLLITCLVLKKKADATYQAEINRLSDLRSQIVHGLATGEMKTLNTHTTSGHTTKRSE